MAAHVSWVCFKTPSAPAQVDWVRFLTPEPSEKGRVSWIKLQVPEKDVVASLSWVKLETPQATVQARFSIVDDVDSASAFAVHTTPSNPSTGDYWNPEFWNPSLFNSTYWQQYVSQFQAQPNVICPGGYWTPQFWNHEYWQGQYFPDPCWYLDAGLSLPGQKHGGDDRYHKHKHKGWNKKAWQKKKKLEDDIEQTIREALPAKWVMRKPVQSKSFEEVEYERLLERLREIDDEESAMLLL